MRTIFIGGSGRCGTKLLRDILGKHSKICALPFPTRFTIDPDGLVDTYKALTTGAWSPYIAGVKLKRLWSMMLDVKPNVFHIPACYEAGQKFYEKMVAYSTDAEWAGGKWWGLVDRKADVRQLMSDLMQAVTGAILEKHGGEIYVDSNTWNPLFTPELMELCPGAIHIHIYRDPRDVVDSMAEQRWCPDDKLECAMMYDAVMEQIEVSRRITTGKYTLEQLEYDPIAMVDCLLNPSPVCEIAFEQLADLPETKINSICVFLGIDYEPAMLEPIDKEAANIGRHRHDPIFQSSEMLEILQPHMERYGYE